MLVLVVILAVGIFVPFIVFYSLKHFCVQNRDKPQKAFAITLLSLEVFKIFLCASFFKENEIPAQNLPFSIFTLLSVLALFAAFSDKRFGKISGNVLAISTAAVIAFACFSEKTFMLGDPLYLSPVASDRFNLFPAIFALQLGSAITTGLLHLQKNNTLNKFDLLFAEGFIIFVLGLTLLVNLAFNSYYLFEYTGEKSKMLIGSLIQNNILANFVLVATSIIFVDIAYFLCKFVLCKKSSDKKQNSEVNE